MKSLVLKWDKMNLFYCYLVFVKNLVSIMFWKGCDSQFLELMSTESNSSQSEKELSDLVLEQKIKGSRKVSNYLVASMLSIGGVGFLLAQL